MTFTSEQASQVITQIDDIFTSTDKTVAVGYLKNSLRRVNTLGGGKEAMAQIKAHLRTKYAENVQYQALLRPLLRLVDVHTIDVQAKDKNSKTLLDRVLQLQDADALELLVQTYGVNIKAAQDEEENTLLHLAVKMGNIAAARILIQSDLTGFLINAQNKQGATPLHIAAEQGNIPMIRLLVELKANVGAVDQDKDTPAHYAAKKNHADVLAVLKNHGADLDVVNAKDQNILHIAAWAGHIDVAKYLLAQKANVTAQGSKGNTSLYLAAFSGHVDICKLLVAAKKESLSIKTKLNYLPLHAAASKGHCTVVQWLVDECKADIHACGNDGKTPLHWAAQNGHIDVVRYLLTQQANILAQDEDGFTPLYHAALNGHLDICKLLMAAKKESLSIKSKLNYLPLHAAASKGHCTVVQWLVDECKADIHACGDNGKTPLHWAMQSGHIDVVKYLLAQKADVLAQDENGYTPLYLAALNGHEDICKLLVAAKKESLSIKSKFNYLPLHAAAGNGHCTVVQWLVEKCKADIHACGSAGHSSLHLAVKGDHREAVAYLLAHHADPMAQTEVGNTSLHLAAEKGYVDICNILVATKKIDINAKNNKGDTPLHRAVQDGHIGVVRDLLSQGADTMAQNEKGITPLHLAAWYGHQAVCELLVAKNKKGNHAKSKNGSTPLHLAAQDGHIDVVRYLLEQGADPMAQDANGNTPLHCAALNNHTDICKLLATANKKTVHAKNFANCTPLHLAAQDGLTDVVSYLLSQGADTMAQVRNNWTPLHLAAWKGHQAVCALLVTANKASLYAKDSNQRTPLYWAAQGGHIDVVRYLLSQGADAMARDDENNLPRDRAREGSEIWQLLKDFSVDSAGAAIVREEVQRSLLPSALGGPLLKINPLINFASEWVTFPEELQEEKPQQSDEEQSEEEDEELPAVEEQSEEEDEELPAVEEQQQLLEENESHEEEHQAEEDDEEQSEEEDEELPVVHAIPNPQPTEVEQSPLVQQLQLQIQAQQQQIQWLQQQLLQSQQQVLVSQQQLATLYNMTILPAQPTEFQGINQQPSHASSSQPIGEDKHTQVVPAEEKRGQIYLVEQVLLAFAKEAKPENLENSAQRVIYTIQNQDSGSRYWNDLLDIRTYPTVWMQADRILSTSNLQKSRDCLAELKQRFKLAPKAMELIEKMWLHIEDEGQEEFFSLWYQLKQQFTPQAILQLLETVPRPSEVLCRVPAKSLETAPLSSNSRSQSGAPSSIKNKREVKEREDKHSVRNRETKESVSSSMSSPVESKREVKEGKSEQKNAALDVVVMSQEEQNLARAVELSLKETLPVAPLTEKRAIYETKSNTRSAQSSQSSSINMETKKVMPVPSQMSASLFFSKAPLSTPSITESKQTTSTLTEALEEWWQPEAEHLSIVKKKVESKADQESVTIKSGVGATDELDSSDAPKFWLTPMWLP